MEIKKTQNGESMVIALTGRLDTTTSPALEAELREVLPKIKQLEFDFTDLVYISSAGLRVLLYAQKTMAKQGGMVIKNVCDDIKEIFEITGFSDILTVE
ncbi:MAG: STAS domain-containing protein [Clostridia bacterium]|nr:STAS domain-containing protein [Clostridia bacterium]